MDKDVGKRSGEEEQRLDLKDCKTNSDTLTKFV